MRRVNIAAAIASSVDGVHPTHGAEAGPEPE
jgi:hypothetical protein